MWRRPAELLILILIAMIALRSWLLFGSLLAIRVAGPSMAEAYAGPHFTIDCNDCGFHFACDATSQRSPSRAVCPNCGFGDNAVDSLTERPGDRLLADRFTYQLREPQRWESVLFRCPERRSDYCLKRIVGLPGEHVRICNGDLYIDGRPAQKTLGQLRELAIPVHDTRFGSRQLQREPRWRPKIEPSGWTVKEAGFRFSPRTDGDATANLVMDEPPIDWLCYQHMRRTRSGIGTANIRIMDDYAYNQTVSRELNVVRDLLLVARLKASGSGRLALSAWTGTDRSTVYLWPAAGKGALHRNESLEIEFEVPRSISRRATELEFATFDQRVVLAIDGRVLMTASGNAAPSASEDGSAQPESSDEECPDLAGNAGLNEATLAMGAAELDVIVENLRVFRDVFYTDARAPVGTVIGSDGIQLGNGEYFVLGDNSPVSRDSRYRLPGAILTDEFILGRVFRWP